jgi:hypothetical protein
MSSINSWTIPSVGGSPIGGLHRLQRGPKLGHEAYPNDTFDSDAYMPPAFRAAHNESHSRKLPQDKCATEWMLRPAHALKPPLLIWRNVNPRGPSARDSLLKIVNRNNFHHITCYLRHLSACCASDEALFS